MCSDQTQIFEVLLPINSNKTFAYKASSALKVGQLISVQFGKRTYIGAVANSESDFTSEKIKEVSQVHVHALRPEFLAFIQAFASYNMVAAGQVLKASINALNFKCSKTVQSQGITQQPISEFIALSTAQEEAYLNLSKHTIIPSVLEGVTGSGKTVVYLKVADEILRTSGQILILLPEIALTAQVIDRCKALLPYRSILPWHSSLSRKNRQSIWQQAVSGEDMIVIGARSALFIPFQNLKLIVIDEEHDASFKQEAGIIYNARDMAVLRGKIESAQVILSSATPSIETLYNVSIGKYRCTELQHRFSGVQMPQIKIVDMNKEQLQKQAFISNPLREALTQQLAASKQSLIFLNRKGYAPLVICRSCGTKLKCINCSSCLVFHKQKKKFICHHCGYTVSSSAQCTNCCAEIFAFYGPGVEKIAEEVHSFLPNARLTIATSDTSHDPQATTLLLNQIKNHETDIVIGTQVMSKGLDFELLQLVCVVDADCNYTTGDIRAHERMYQLLSQVSGRPGRRQEQGLVLMQSYNSDSHILRSIVTGDKEGFISLELQDRKIAHMPPFTRLAIIDAACKNEHKLIEFMHQMADSAPIVTGVKIMGPAPSPLAFLKKEFRQRFILRGEKNIHIQKTIWDWLNLLKVPTYIKIKIDIDPYNFN